MSPLSFYLLSPLLTLFLISVDRVLNKLNYDTVFKFFSMTFKSKLFHFHDSNPNWQPHVFLKHFHFYIINFCRTLFSLYCFWIVHMRLGDCCSHPSIHLFIRFTFFKDFTYIIHKIMPFFILLLIQLSFFTKFSNQSASSCDFSVNFSVAWHQIFTGLFCNNFELPTHVCPPIICTHLVSLLGWKCTIICAQIYLHKDL